MTEETRTITAKGNALTLIGKPLGVGDMLPVITLTAQDMSDLKTSSFAGKPIIISTVPSLDTSVCALETKRFNQEAAKFGDKVTVLTISRDLPFAQKRWCGAEGASNVVVASDYKYHQAGSALSVLIKEWELLARAVFVADASGKITYVEYVSEVSEEPTYEAVLKAAVAALG